MYAVGVSSDISKLRTYFANNGKLEDNCDGVFEATEAEQIAESFQTILDNITTNTNVSTNTSSSHSVQYNNAGKIENYSIKDVKQIVLELTNTTDNKTITMTFDKDKSSDPNTYDLEKIYDAESGVISLYEAWLYSGLDATSIEDYNDKVITVYTEQ